MKKINLFFIIMIAVGAIFSCKEKELDPVLDMSQTVAPNLIQPVGGTVYELKQDSADSVLVVFKWTPAEYSLDDLPEIRYNLQVDLADNNFSNPRTLASSANTTYTLTVGKLNSELMAMGIEPGNPADIAFRVTSFINNETQQTNAYSEPVIVNATGYEDVTSFPSLWIPGDYQGWDPASAPQIYDFNNDGVFNGYFFVPEGGTYEFKFTSAPDWDHTNFGFGGEGVLSTDPGAGNLSVPGPGGYMVEVDTVNLTWTYELQNWGIIGEWLSWEEDINMEWDSDNQYLYKVVEDIPPADNQRFKFRANDAWDLNLGAKDPDDGTLVQGGEDIPIPEGGTKKIILRFTTPEPTYEVIDM